MATSNRDIKLRLQVETLGADAVRSLAGDVRGLAEAGDSAAPEFERLASELDKIAGQVAAVETFKALNAELSETVTRQRQVAESSDQLATAYNEAKDATQRSAEAQRTAREELQAQRTALVQAKGAVEVLKAEYDAAGKRTLDYRTQLAALKEAVTAANVALVEKRQAVRDSSAEVAKAEAAERKLATQYERSQKAVAAAEVAVAKGSSTLKAAGDAARELGVEIDDLATAEQRLQAAQQETITAAIKQQAVQVELAEADRQALIAAEGLALALKRNAQAYEDDQRAAREAAIATEQLAKAMREASNAELAESNRLIAIETAAMAKQIERGRAALIEEQAALKDAADLTARLAAEKKAAAVAALQFVEGEERAAESARLAAIELDKIGAAARKLNADAEYVREFAALLDKAEAEAKQAAESMLLLVRNSQAAGRAIDESFRQLGARSLNAIEKEIGATQAALSTLERKFQQGAIGAQELARATAFAEARLNTLQAEILATPNIAGPFERLSGTISGLINRFGALTAAVGTVGIAVTPIVQAYLSLERLERTLNTVTGSSAETAKQIEFLRDVAQRSGQQFDKITDSYGKFVASAGTSGIAMSTVQAVFESVANAAGNLGLSADRTGQILDALSQIAGKGVVSMEELRQQLGDSLPGALALTAKGLGITTADLIKLVESGNLLSEDVLPALATSLVELGSKSGQVEGLAAEFNRLVNTIKEGGTLLADGAIGQAIGVVLNAISEALKGVVGTAVIFNEVFGGLIKIVALAAAGITGSLKDWQQFKDEFAAIFDDAGERIENFSKRAFGTADAAKVAGDSAAAAGQKTAAAGDQIAAATPKIEAHGVAHEKGAAAAAASGEAQAKAGSAAVAAGEQAVAAAQGWVALEVAYTKLNATTEQQLEVAARATDAQKIAGETALRTIELTGNEVAIKQVAVASAQAYSTALANEAAASAKVTETLIEQKLALEAAAAAEGGLTEAKQKRLAELAQEIEQSAAVAEVTKQAAAAAELEVAALQQASEAAKDNSGRLEELKGKVTAAEAAIKSIALSMVSGTASTEDLAKANTELAKAKGLLLDALKDTEAALQRDIELMKASTDVARANLELKLAEAKGLESTGRLIRDENLVKQAQLSQKRIEIDLLKLGNTAKKEEAEKTIETTKALLAELEASNNLTPEKRTELEIRIKNAEAKVLESKAGDQQVKSLENEITKLREYGDAASKSGRQAADSFKTTRDEITKTVAALSELKNTFDDYKKSSLTYDSSGFATAPDGSRIGITQQADIPEGGTFDQQAFMRESQEAARTGGTPPDPQRFVRSNDQMPAGSANPWLAWIERNRGGGQSQTISTPAPAPALAPAREQGSQVSTPSPTVSSPSASAQEAPQQVRRVEVVLPIGNQTVTLPTSEEAADQLLRAIEDARRSSGIGGAYQ